MTQKRIKMKSVAPPMQTRAAEDSDAARNAALADQFLQDNDYLPVRGDQSWRELAALRIAAEFEPKDKGDAPEATLAGEDRIPQSKFSSGSGGGIVAAIFAAAIIVPPIAALTAPEILTAGFWGAHHATPNAMAEPRSLSTRTAAKPTPLRASLAKATPPPNNSNPMAVEQGLNGQPAARTPPSAGRAPKTRPALPVAQREKAGNDYKFRTLVVGTDGSMKYEYFSSQPSSRMAQREEAGDDGKGFYAMVPDENGTLQYRYFPFKPVR